MKFSVITLFPELIEAIFSQGVVGQARIKKHLEIETLNPRKFTTDIHKTVDDRPFGGGDGMIMLAEPLAKSIQELKTENSKVIYLSPQGKKLNEEKIQELRGQPHLILICGRYGGIDQRLINELVDEEISIGDYVLSGGELPAAVLIESLARKIPGVLGHENSAQEDSFSTGLLEEPSFTRPREILGQSVPEILLSGDHKKISLWREKIRGLVTLKKRPELLKESQKPSLREFWKSLSDSDKKSLGLKEFP